MAQPDQTYYINYDGNYYSNYPLGNKPLEWLIPLANRVGQKLPMRVICRPDNETDANSYLRNANTNFTYEQPICIQGGERPLRFEILAAPEGATIVSEMTRSVDVATGKILHTRQKEHGLLSWTPTSGSHTFTIQATDQNEDTITMSWTVLVDNTKFVIIDAATATSGSGTWASPLKTWNDLWGNSANTSFANKIAYFKAGTYLIAESGGTDVSVNTNVKPLAYIGASTGGVVFDNSGGHFYVNRGDVAFRNISFTDFRVVNDVRIIQVSTKNSNYLFDNLLFDNNGIGTVATDNPACIMFTGADEYTYNVAVINSECGDDCKMQLITTFNVDGVLIENNYLHSVLPSSNGDVGIHIKDDSKHVTLAFNKVIGVYPNGSIRVSNQQNTLNGSGSQEVCYNTVVDLVESWGFEGSTVSWNQNSTGQPNPLNMFCYRNSVKTIQYAYTYRDWLDSENYVQSSGDAYSAYGFALDDAFTAVSPSSIELTEDDFDVDGKLTNTNNARTLYLGNRGAEISSTV